MHITDQLTQQLSGLSSSQPATLTLHGDAGVTLELDFAAVDTLACALRELRISVPALAAGNVDTLKAWSEELSRRVTYLLERIGPVELDSEGETALVRSTPPDRRGQASAYYEILLSAHAHGTFSLRRYRVDKSQPARTPIDMQLTREILTRLVQDVVETIPASP